MLQFPQTEIARQVLLFAREWELSTGYKPAAFQKAIAMQRLSRGQSIAQIVDALIDMRIS